MRFKYAAVLLLALSPLAAQAGDIHDEIRSELKEARAEVRTELAEERAKLERENLSLRDSLQFGRRHHWPDANRDAIPEAEITPQGDLLVDGKAVAIDAGQRAMLLDYRGQVIALAKKGIDAGERAAMLALEATDVGLFRMFVGAMTGSLERKVRHAVEREVKPAVLEICRDLPRLRQTQQALAASIPEFAPYATLEERDVRHCERDVQREFAMH